MSADGSERRLAAGRMVLSVRPGAAQVVYVHELAAPDDVRQHRMRDVRRMDGATSFDQRGHCGSSWVRGGLYRFADFALDLLAVIQAFHADGVVVVGQGAGAVVAVMAATIEPDSVVGLDLVSARGDGWGEVLGRERRYGNGEMRKGWVDLMSRTSTPSGPSAGGPGCTDPVLGFGPPSCPSGGELKAMAASVACAVFADEHASELFGMEAAGSEPHTRYASQPTVR